MEIENNKAAFEEKSVVKKSKKLPVVTIFGVAALVLLLIISAAVVIADHSGSKKTHGVYSINGDAVESIAPFSSGIAVLTSNSVDYVDQFGNLMGANEHNYTNPVMITSGKNLALYDRGGTSLKIEKNASLYKEHSFESPITCVDITSKGTYAFVLNADNGYQTHLFAYSYNGKKLFEWTSAEYALCVSVSNTGKHAAVCTLSVNNAEAVSKVYFFSFNKPTHDYMVEFADETVFDVSFVSSKKVVVLTDRGAYQLNQKGEKSVLCEYSANELNHTDLYNAGMGVCAIDLYGNSNNTKVFLFDRGYKNVYENTYQDSISRVIADENYCAIVFDKQIRILSAKNVETGVIDLDEICLDAVISGGRLYVLTAGGIEHYSLHETEGQEK